MDREEIKAALREVLEEETNFGHVPLAERWLGGEVIIAPRDKSLQEKRIPIDAFFKKIIMIRDRLRVLEQKINGHEKLTEEDKIELQSYITKAYGSLTTFNVLFKNKSQNFVGESGKRN